MTSLSPIFHDSSLNGPVPTACPPGTPYWPPGVKTPSLDSVPLLAPYFSIAVGLWMWNEVSESAPRNDAFGRRSVITAVVAFGARQLRYSGLFVRPAGFFLYPLKTV